MRYPISLFLIISPKFFKKSRDPEYTPVVRNFDMHVVILLAHQIWNVWLHLLQRYYRSPKT